MKILVIHTAFIGDIILSTPMIRQICEKHHVKSMDYLTTPLGASLLKNNPYLNKIISYDKHGKDKGFSKLLEFSKILQEEKYDVVYVPHRYLRSSFLAWKTKAPLRIGYKEASGSVFLNQKISYAQNLHEVERLASLVGISHVKSTSFPLELYPSKEDFSFVESFLKEKEIKEFIVIAPGSKWFTKMWPLEYFNELIKKLSFIYPILIIGGKEEKSLSLYTSSSVFSLCGETSLLQSAALLKYAKALVSNDSSPIHMAAAFHTPTFALFGATTPSLGFAPWNPQGYVLEVLNLPCRPCGLHGGKTCPQKHFKCMRDLTPDLIYDTIKVSLKF